MIPSEHLKDLWAEFKVGSGLSIKRKNGGVEVFDKLVEGFLSGGDDSVGHFVIPHFREGDSLSFAHFVKHSRDLSFICVVDGRVDVEVWIDGFHPALGICRFFREVSRKCCFEFRVGGGHGGGCWGCSGLWWCWGKNLLSMKLGVT